MPQLLLIRAHVTVPFLLQPEASKLAGWPPTLARLYVQPAAALMQHLQPWLRGGQDGPGAPVLVMPDAKHALLRLGGLTQVAQLLEAAKGGCACTQLLLGRHLNGAGTGRCRAGV